MRLSGAFPALTSSWQPFRDGCVGVPKMVSWKAELIHHGRRRGPSKPKKGRWSAFPACKSELCALQNDVALRRRCSCGRRIQICRHCSSTAGQAFLREKGGATDIEQARLRRKSEPKKPLPPRPNVLKSAMALFGHRKRAQQRPPAWQQTTNARDRFLQMPRTHIFT